MGATVERLPDTSRLRHGVALVAAGGKGYTWVAETAEEAAAWHGDLRLAIRSCRAGGTESLKVHAAPTCHAAAAGAHGGERLVWWRGAFGLVAGVRDRCGARSSRGRLLKATYCF